jgi:hypothetical protein
MTEADRTRPSAQTREEEDADARVSAKPDAAPTKDEEEAAARAKGGDEASSRAYKEAIERGADAKGEGKLP